MLTVEISICSQTVALAMSDLGLESTPTNRYIILNV